MRIQKEQTELRFYPIALNLNGKTVVIVGGGSVAERKVHTIHKTDARIAVIAPALTPGLSALAQAGEVEWIPRCVRQEDVRDAYLIIAATNDATVNASVARWAQEYQAMVNVVDKPALSDFISPALLYADEALIAVYTDGHDPVLSRDLKNYLKEHWHDFLHYRN